MGTFLDVSVYAIPSGSMSYFVNIGTDEAEAKNIVVIVYTLCRKLN